MHSVRDPSADQPLHKYSMIVITIELMCNLVSFGLARIRMIIINIG